MPEELTIAYVDSAKKIFDLYSHLYATGPISWLFHALEHVLGGKRNDEIDL